MTEWEPGWPALAEAVRQRRARLGLNQEDIPTRGGPSSSTVRKIEGAAAGNYQGARHEVFNETNSAEVLGDLIDFLGVVR